MMIELVDSRGENGSDIVLFNGNVVERLPSPSSPNKTKLNPSLMFRQTQDKK